ncbi:MAG: endonuclease/exonuclease/phosphatase family protein [Clostridia bacterium]|nr:endonuclease/exonuclease/phosphatase family protein [Clostridia bacterium]
MKHITIATYNIRHGHDVDCDWSKIAEIVAESGADIIGFQEIDMHTGRVGGRDTVAGLATATGLSHALFVPAMDFDGGQYGTAILSRFPIVSYEEHALNAGIFEPRSYGCATITLDDGKPFLFLNTHLSYESHEQQNIQFAQLASWMGKHIPADTPAVLTGDFNTEDFSAFSPLKALGYALINSEAHRFDTFRTTGIAIDNIVYSCDHLAPMACGMIDSNRSDHNLIWCRFELL